MRIIKELSTTYHTYFQNNQRFLKKTYWYKMKTNYSKATLPQIEEGITKVSWVNKDQLEKKMRNSYGNIKDILNNIVK